MTNSIVQVFFGLIHLTTYSRRLRNIKTRHFI